MKNLENRSETEKNVIVTELTEQVKYAKNELKLAHDLWKKREGRPEDMGKIEFLEHELEAMAKKESKTREEMLYFKRELLNREDNFNNKFSGGPNVPSTVKSIGILTAKKSGFDNSQQGHSVKRVSKQKRRRHTSFPHLPSG